MLLDVQDLVFKSKYDGSLKTALKNCQSPTDALDHELIRARWEIIETKSAGMAAQMLPAVPDSLSEVHASEVGDEEMVLMSAVFAPDRLQSLSSEQRNLVKDSTEEAKRLVAAGVRLLDGMDSERSLIQALRDSPISRIQGGVDGYVVIIYDLKSSGEDPTDAAQRSAPLRTIHVEGRTGIALKARSVDDDTINPGDMWVILDDGRFALGKQLQGSLKPCPKTSKVLHTVYSEDGLVERRKALSTVGQARSRGFMTLRQVEGVHFIAAADCAKLQQRSNRHFEGSSSGDALVAVGVPDMMKDGWLMTVAEKRILMGTSVEPLAPTDTPGEDGSTFEEVEQSAAKRQRRGDHETVPFNFMHMIPEVYDEIMHHTGAKAVVDLTASDGVLALTCLQAGTPYFGFCHNSLHVAALTRRLQSKVFAMLSNESCVSFYNPSLGELLVGSADVDPVTERAAPKIKAKAKSAPSRGKTAKAIKAAAKRTSGVKRVKRSKREEAFDGEDGKEESSDEEESPVDSPDS